MLGTQELGDADLIVTLLTERHGKVRAVARSARRSRRRFGGCLEPLTRVQATWLEHELRDLGQLEQVEASRSFAEMQADPLRQAACAVLAEVAAGFVHEGQADPQEFRLLAAVLDAIEGGAAPWAMLRYFEYWTLRVHGLLPDLASCAGCGRSLGSARSIRVTLERGPLCSSCLRQAGEQELRLDPADLEFLEALRRHPPAALPGAGPTARPRAALELLLRGTLEAFAERAFRSYRHFKARDRFAAGGEGP